MFKLDYTITSPQERIEYVNSLISSASANEVSPLALERFADYIILAQERAERYQRKHELNTPNRLTTINKRETSFEGLAESFENGEDGIYSLINAESRNPLLTPKLSITSADLSIPFMQQLRDSIRACEDRLPSCSGRDAYIIKRTIIDLRKDQYLLRDAYRKPISPHTFGGSTSFPQSLDLLGDNPLSNPDVCSAILCNYSRLKQDSYDRLDSDMWALMQDFDRISARALAAYPIYELLVTLKIDGLTNVQIRNAIQADYGISHSLEYISSLWRHKIPTIISSAAVDEYNSWHYLNVAPGRYKRCSRCNHIKLALPKYFSANKCSRDGFYSICKSCRNKHLGKLDSQDQPIFQL